MWPVNDLTAFRLQASIRNKMFSVRPQISKTVMLNALRHVVRSVTYLFIHYIIITYLYDTEKSLIIRARLIKSKWHSFF